MKNAAIASLFTVRIFALLVAIWQVIGILPIIAWPSSPEPITSGMWFIVGLKALALAVCIAVFLGSGRAIARLKKKSPASP